MVIMVVQPNLQFLPLLSNPNSLYLHLHPRKTISPQVTIASINGSQTLLTILTRYSSHSSHSSRIRAYSSSEEEANYIDNNGIPPNALRRKTDPNLVGGGFSLGVDLGMSRTGVALSKGFSIRPLTVLELRGQKLEQKLLEIAEREEADEFIIGLPKSVEGKETTQSNKVRSVAGRLAVRAAERGWRVYLQDEHGTSMEALDLMIDMGVKRSARQGQSDAYAAVMVLQRYFEMSGEGTELVLPKQLDLQEKIKRGPPKDLDFYPEERES